MKAIFIGECMIELSTLKGGLMQKSFAGDAFNSAVYMKRLMQKKCEVSFLTAIGKDQVSMEMETFFKDQDLSTNIVFKSSEGTVGLYLITPDKTGEKSFSYWRQNSIARRLMYILQNADIKLIDYNADMIFFTGITLAILDDRSRKYLLDQLSTASENGTKIAFDPNYRHQLWGNKSTAAKWIETAYQVSDIIFPSLEEEEHLFSTASVKACLKRLDRFNIQEIVLKAGNKGVYVQTSEKLVHHAFVPAGNVVDTTAAGDSFDGSFLAMRMLGENMEVSLSKAAEVAANVISLPGAIVSTELM